MGTLTVAEAKRQYEKQLAEVERDLSLANQRVEVAEVALRAATAKVVRTGGMTLLSEDVNWREADEAVMSAKSARSRLDDRRSTLRARLRGLGGA